ncbi:ABC transporter substrate-binding protein/permease [Vagococcus sp. BWB3-3]|uniref:ABC transporter substrate-binding protein/permease n=1 Tax=Vagococcus allomyrinae TaxID=2794353 RepID=A0A940SWA6_9ENTE|nr:ABC transporter substrate-binding protein/permease [Vagococcus allomyrinae]MBP1041891.1 ABC transporter substrate-binding protein/permease [Vagococcus allomyrinae]
MKKNAYKFLSIIIFAIILFISSGSVQGAESDAYYDSIQKKGELVVGLSADYPPYEFHATVDGKDTVVGFDIAIAKKIADDLGVKLKIQELGFDALLGSLQTGKIDIIISGMSPTPERLKEVNFSDTYMYVQQKVVIRKEDSDKFKTTADFSGVGVAAQKQTTQEELAQTELTGSKVTSLQKVPEMILSLQNKKVDALVLEGPVAEAYLLQDKNLVASDVEFENGNKETAIALPKNAPVLEGKINDTLADIEKQDLMPGYIEEASNLMFNEESFFQKYGSYYVKGAGFTILIAFIGVLFGSIVGGFLALLKLSKNKVLRFIAMAYIEYVRGTPLLVQIFLVYFGSTVIGLELNAIISGCVAMALNSGAYVAEIIRAGINGVPKGQVEASRSLGMNQRQAMQFIILPQAIKNILPALGNEFVTIIKESSVMSVIGVSELMFQSGVVQGASFKPFLPIVIASLIYFVLTFSLSRLLNVFEKKMSASDA